jgi:predicted porin
MKKCYMAAVIGCSALIVCAQTQAEELKVYGRAHLGVENSDTGSGSDTSVESYASRMGIKGSADIDTGISAFYKLEFQVEMSENDNDGKSEENITARSQYVGVKGRFGQLLLGRDDTPMKKSQGKVDLMNDFSADIKSFFVGENRLGDTLQYTTPSLNHLQFTVSYIAEDNSKQNGESGLSMAASYGDSKLKKTAIYASVARDEEVAGQDITRVTVQGKVAKVTLGASYQQSEAIGSNETVDSYMASAALKLDNGYKLLAQYQNSDGASGKLKDSGDAASIGVEKSLSKQARMYLWYTKIDLDNNSDQDHMALTLRYDF